MEILSFRPPPHPPGGVQGWQATRIDAGVDTYVKDRILAPLSIDVGTEQEVSEADETLRAEHSLPEIHGVAHLGHEGDEEKSSGICVDHGTDGVELRGETSDLLLVFSRRWASKCHNLHDLLDVGGACHCDVIDRIVTSGNHALQKSVMVHVIVLQKTYMMMKFAMFIQTPDMKNEILAAVPDGWMSVDVTY